MTTSPIAEKETHSAFVCEKATLGSCEGEPFYAQHEGKRYCVLHLPRDDKSEVFNETISRKIKNKDLDFGGVWFPAGSNLSLLTFSDPTNFTDATFNGDVDFFGAFFNNNVTFKNADFSGKAGFMGATFEGEVLFTLTRFRGVADFKFARFEGYADFSAATFDGRVEFASGPRDVFPDTSSLDLRLARFEKPDECSFHTVKLCPYWFVNVDARKFVFTNVEWDWRSTDKEIGSLQRNNVGAAHRLLAIACRHLASNAEESHRYEEASRFRYMAMDARRLEQWRGFDFRTLSWWYWLASGYGERIARAAVVLLTIFLISAALYTQVGFARWEPRLASESDSATTTRDDIGAPLKLSRAITYSGAVMTFQRPEPRPATTAAQTVVLLETILGPVQAALLALAIRRKFMR
jgi:hypothetical protein